MEKKLIPVKLPSGKHDPEAQISSPQKSTLKEKKYGVEENRMALL
jgi:hypothetical protein